MANDVFRPFISYANNTTYLYPDVGLVTPLVDVKSTERYGNVSASGVKHTYYVGARTFIRVQFEWQTSAQKTLWETFWDAVKDGDEFVYHDDDSYTLCGTGTASTTTVCGTLATGGATDLNRTVVIENDEFIMEPMEVSGYFRTPVLELRVV